MWDYFSFQVNAFDLRYNIRLYLKLLLDLLKALDSLYNYQKNVSVKCDFSETSICKQIGQGKELSLNLHAIEL